MEENRNNIEGISEKTAQTLMQSLQAMATETPFATAEIKRLTDEIIGIIHRNIAVKCASLMTEYYKRKWEMIFAEWPMRWYRRMRARKALRLYHNAFRILVEFKRRFGYEETE